MPRAACDTKSFWGMWGDMWHYDIITLWKYAMAMQLNWYPCLYKLVGALYSLLFPFWGVNNFLLHCHIGKRKIFYATSFRQAMYVESYKILHKILLQDNANCLPTSYIRNGCRLQDGNTRARFLLFWESLPVFGETWDYYENIKYELNWCHSRVYEVVKTMHQTSTATF